MLKLLPSLLILACVLFSCKKESNDPMTLLTSKPWKRAYTDKNTSTNPPDAIYIPLTDCLKDDTYKFGQYGRLKIDNGSNHCSANENSKDNFDYSVDFTNKRIIINGQKYIIAELSSTQLKYYLDIPAYTGYNTKVVSIFEH